MALRRKVLLVVGASLAGLIIVLYLISRALLLNSYVNLEEQDVRRNVQRALNNLQNETEALSSTAADWAYWDDTYAFAQTGDQEYIDSNINDATFTSISLNLMVVIDKQGRMLLGKGYDLVNGAETALPAGLDPYLAAGSSMLTRRDDDHFTGLVLVGDVPMLLASRAVLTTDKKGPSMGTLIFGRILDDSSIADIAQATQLTLSVQRINDPALPTDFQSVSGPLSQSQTVVVQPADNDLVNGYHTA
jgi:sensor domain CHASE-containing protein